MKRLVYGALISAISVSACSQNVSVDTRHKIEVSGSAEADVTPDIIYVGISLKEFFNADKARVEIEHLEKQLQSAALKAGIPKENFTINNISSYNYMYERRRNPTFLARKQYRLKVSDLNKFNQIISSIDPKAIEYTNIEGYDYSKIESIKQDLKIKALKAAKDKATYLAAAVDSKVGDALEINEITNEHDRRRMYAANGAMTEAMATTQAAPDMPEIDFKKIKLNYQMRAVFELKN